MQTLCSRCSQPIKPIVAVDIDGTLGEYHEPFRCFAEKYWGRPLRMHYNGNGDFEDWLGLSQQDYRQAKLAYRQGGFKRFQPLYPGAVKFMESLREHGFEIWIATTRPWQRLDNIDPDTRFWLEKNKIPYDGVLFGDDKYKQLCDTIEKSRVVAVVEDLPEQWRIANQMGLRPILIERPHNASDRPIASVRTFELALINILARTYPERLGGKVIV